MDVSTIECPRDLQIEPIEGVPELPYGYQVSTADKSITAHGITAQAALVRGLSMVGFRGLSAKDMADVLFWRYGPPYVSWWREAIGVLAEARGDNDE